MQTDDARDAARWRKLRAQLEVQKSAMYGGQVLAFRMVLNSHADRPLTVEEMVDGVCS